MNTFLYFLPTLLFPIMVACYCKYTLKYTYSAMEATLNVVLVAALSFGILFAGSYASMRDTQILNGEIVSKHREHGSYIRTYQCNCRTNKDGMTTCSTCTENRYTVDWFAKSTVGQINFKNLDSGSRSVYNTPDPAVYTNCTVGEPASLEQEFENYVKATPESLFNTNMEEQVYADKVPQYPNVVSFYKVNRVLTVGDTISYDESVKLNNLFNDRLRILGPTKQANIIVILTDIKDPYYKNVVENSWIGGKKNDIILFFGLDGKNIVWSDVMTWAKGSGNEMMISSLKYSFSEMKLFDNNAVVNVTYDHILQMYTRPEMEDYEYLLDDIEPPLWSLIAAWALGLMSTLGLAYFFHKHTDI